MKILTSLAVLATALTLPTASASAEVPQMYGMVVSSDNYTQPGLWSLPVESGGDWNMLFQLQTGTATVYSGVLNESENIYYVTRCDAQYGTALVYLDAYSVETGTKLWTNYPNLTFLPYDLTYNPYDGRIYGLFSNSTNSGMVLATVTYGNQSSTLSPICNMEGNWVAIAADASGQLYGIASEISGMNGVMPIVESSTLYKIDRLTGETTPVGVTGQKPLMTGSATIDQRTGRMFWTVMPTTDSSYLCEVDLATGAATKVFDFDNTRQITGMYSLTPAAENDAPAEVTDASAAFEGGSLSGRISFTCPTTLFDGTPATGDLTYSIITDGVEIAAGNTSYGASENVDVTVADRGQHTFVITVSNENGPSPKVNVEKFVGFGVPAAPAEVSAVNNGAEITVSWNAVTESADGGYLDPRQVTYDVTRLPDNTVVASATQNTRVSVAADNDSPIQSYTFAVTAVNNGLESQQGVSEPVVTGFAVLPWEENFNDASSMNFFRIIDANADGKTWGFMTDRARISYGTVDMDDWLITPPMKVEAGVSYKVSLKARCGNSSYPEKLEVKWGKGNSAADMTASVVATTSVGDTEYMVIEGHMNPTESGTAYVGIHGISAADMYNLEIDDIRIEAGINTLAPETPSAFTVTPDVTGELKAHVSVTAPLTNINGDNLESLAKLVVTRDGAEAKVFDSPAPGSTLEFDDTLPAAGTVAYKAVAYNASGAGRPAETEVFIGTPLAEAPAYVNISEVAPGYVTLEWPNVDKTADGIEIDRNKVRYSIYDLMGDEPVLLQSPIECSPLSLAPVEEGEQKFVRFGVASLTDRGETEPTETAIIPVGTAYTDFSESFAGGELSTIVRTERLNYGNWGAMTDDGEVTSQDGDGGFYGMKAYFAGYNGAFYTGKISLAGMSVPVLSFYSYTPDNEKADLNTIEVSASTDGQNWTPLFSGNVTEIGDTQGWHEVNVQLAQFAGKDVSLRFFAETYNRPYVTTYIDNIRVFEQSEVELQLTSAKAPAHVRRGEAFTLDATVTNLGSGTASGYDLELYADGELVETKQGEDIASLATVTVPFELTMSPFAGDSPIVYTVTAVHPDDARTDNNTSDETPVVPVAVHNPAPTALGGSHDSGAVQLNWQSPALETSAPAAVTDDFESAEAWAHNAPGWIFIDRDQAPLCAFGEIEVPGVTAGKTTGSFLTFSATDVFEGNIYLLPHSGSQYLVAFARFDDGTTDDWAISPELSGDAQQVSFFAKSYHHLFPERIEVYYSTGSFDPDDFISTGVLVEQVSPDWTEYKADVPEGARYVAVRSFATGSFMLMLDDFTYAPASSHNISLAGYNVYRDNVKINDTPVAATTYTDAVENPEEHSWTVTAVYDRGESGPSNVLTYEQVGIDGIADGIAVRAEAGAIIVTGAYGLNVTVASIDGKAVCHTQAPDTLRIDVAPGVYTVTVNSRTVKLIVR